MASQAVSPGQPQFSERGTACCIPYRREAVLHMHVHKCLRGTQGQPGAANQVYRYCIRTRGQQVSLPAAYRYW